VQVDPIKPVSKAPSDELFSIFAFKFNLRHYIQALKGEEIKAKIKAFTTKAGAYTRPLLTST